MTNNNNTPHSPASLDAVDSPWPIVDPAEGVDRAGLSVEDDLRLFWLPSVTQRHVAAALVRRLEPRWRSHVVAVVGLALPGKQFGIWMPGQPVEPVLGTWLVWVGSDNVTLPMDVVPVTGTGRLTVQTTRMAQFLATEAARARLAVSGSDGTTSWAYVDVNGEATVFECP